MRVQEDYYVPSSVAAHLDFISPTLRFPVESHTHSMALIGTKGDTSIKADTTYVTPSSLKSLYGVGDVKGGLSSDNVQVVASFLQEWFNDDDLEQFWNFFSLDEADVTRFPDSQPEGYGSEAELDVQCMFVVVFCMWMCFFSGVILQVFLPLRMRRRLIFPFFVLCIRSYFTIFVFFFFFLSMQILLQWVNL